jgi:hypothetical protein
MITVLLVSFAGCGSPSEDLSGPPLGDDARAFTAGFVERANAQDPALGIAAAGDLAVQLPGGPPVDLTNLWGECRDRPTACDESMARWIRVIAQSDTEAPFDPAQLRVALLDGDAAGSMGLVTRPWVGPVVQVLLLDLPDTLEMPRRDELAGFGIPEDALWERALANTDAATSHTVAGAPLGPGSLVTVGSFSNEGGARLLFPDDWAVYPTMTGRPLYVAAPARDVVVWVDDMSGREGDAFRWLAQAMYAGEPHPISPAIFRWTPHGFALEDANTRPIER